MGQGFLFKEKVLCGDCFKEAEDWEAFEGHEAPQRNEVEGDYCAKCGTPLSDIAQPYE